MASLPSGSFREPDLSETRTDQVAKRTSAPLRIALALKRFVDHPMTKLGVGLILIATGLIEAYDTVLDDFHRLRVRVGHGVVILGVVHVLASLPDVIEGIEHWLNYLEEGREGRPRSQDGPDAGLHGGRSESPMATPPGPPDAVIDAGRSHRARPEEFGMRHGHNLEASRRPEDKLG